MTIREMCANRVIVKLDPENDRIGKLFIDTSFEPEKHITVTGEIAAIPKSLYFTGNPNGMEWETDLEVKVGDRVVVYYMAVVNALARESSSVVIEDGVRYIPVRYQNIYAILRENEVIPINGYCLVEPIDSDEIKGIKNRLAAQNLILPEKERKSNHDVVYSRVVYLGKPNKRYINKDATDETVDVKVGDQIVTSKITDIPLEYEMHRKVDKSRVLFRVQRRNILAIL